MKKFFTILMMSIMLISLVGCGNDDSSMIINDLTTNETAVPQVTKENGNQYISFEVIVDKKNLYTEPNYSYNVYEGAYCNKKGETRGITLFACHEDMTEYIGKKVQFDFVREKGNSTFSLVKYTLVE